MNINGFWKIEFFSGEIIIIKSHCNYKDLTKKLFFEYGAEIKNVKNANYSDVNWYRQDNIVKEI